MVPRSNNIPNNIFQICLRGRNSSASDVLNLLPDSFLENIQTLSSRNPAFIYQLFSDNEAEDFIKSQFGTELLKYYQRIDKQYLAAKADLLRYLLLYAQGGVYLDLKSTVDHPLHGRIRPDDQYLVFYWDNLPNGQHHCLIPDSIPKGEMLQAFIVAAKGHPFIREVIIQSLARMDSYNPYKDGVGWTGVLQTTGPVVYTQTIFSLIQSEGVDSALFREDLPFNNFGFKVSFQGDYNPGQYQKQLSLRDYRSCSRPVIKSNSPGLQYANVAWLAMLRLYRKYILRAE